MPDRKRIIKRLDLWAYWAVNITVITLLVAFVIALAR